MASLPFGAPDAEVAFSAGLQHEVYHVQWLDEPFQDFAHEGHPVDRFVACRPSSFRCRSPDACGLFLDCRALGRPVCFRSSHSSRLEAADLLRLVEVELPPNYSLCVVGGVFDMQLEAYRFADGDRVVLWARSIGPDGSSCPGSEDSYGQSEDNDDEEESDHAPSQASTGDSLEPRSRSPRDRQGPWTEGGQECSHSAGAGPTTASIIPNPACDLENVNMWKGRFVQHACLSCHAVDTSVHSSMSSLPAATHICSGELPSDSSLECDHEEVYRQTTLRCADQTAQPELLGRVLPLLVEM